MAARAKSGQSGRFGAQNGKDGPDRPNRCGGQDGCGEPNRCGLCGGQDGSDGLNGRGLCDRQDVRDGRGGMQATGRAGAGRGKVCWVAFIGYTAILRAGSPKAPRELPPEGSGTPKPPRWPLEPHRVPAANKGANRSTPDLRPTGNHLADSAISIVRKRHLPVMCLSLGRQLLAGSQSSTNFVLLPIAYMHS